MVLVFHLSHYAVNILLMYNYWTHWAKNWAYKLSWQADLTIDQIQIDWLDELVQQTDLINDSTDMWSCEMI